MLCSLIEDLLRSIRCLLLQLRSRGFRAFFRPKAAMLVVALPRLTNSFESQGDFIMILRIYNSLY